MSQGDLEDLAALWRDEPDAAEQEQLQRLARKARRRGRLVDYVDLTMVVLVIGGSVAAAFAARSPLLMAGALVLIVATVWLTWKRRTIRQMTRDLVTTDRDSFLAGSIRHTKANLRRNTLSLIAFPLIVPLAVLLKRAATTGGDPYAALVGLVQWAGSQRGLITLSVLSLMILFLLRSRHRQQAELRRLEDLRKAYEEEARRDVEADL
jgi:hypothetical protein